MDQLTIVQNECTKLLLEKRELASKVGLAGALAQVREFNEKFGVPISNGPELPYLEIQRLRRDLITEEYQEFLAAWHVDDLVGIADALADMIYVILGAALGYGIPIAEIFDEVHASNMRKDGGALRADKKILKPEGWVAPDVRGILLKAGMGED